MRTFIKKSIEEYSRYLQRLLELLQRKKKAQDEEKRKLRIQMKEMYQIQIMYLLHCFQEQPLAYRHQKGPNSETMMA